MCVCACVLGIFFRTYGEMHVLEVQLSGWICIAKANWPAPLALLWAEAANKTCLRRIIHGFNSPKNASTSWKIMKIRRKKIGKSWRICWKNMFLSYRVTFWRLLIHVEAFHQHPWPGGSFQGPFTGEGVRYFLAKVGSIINLPFANHLT